MKISVHLRKNERLTNFSFAEAVWEVCEEEANDLDASTVARMMLVQAESQIQCDTETANSIGF